MLRSATRQPRADHALHQLGVGAVQARGSVRPRARAEGLIQREQVGVGGADRPRPLTRRLTQKKRAGGGQGQLYHGDQTGRGSWH